MNKQIKVDTDNGVVLVAKLPIVKYVELLKAMRKLPKELVARFNGVDLTHMSNDKILEMVPEIVETSLPDVLNVLTIATPLEREAIEALGLDDIVNLVLAVVEVNNYKGIYDSVKKALARPEPVKTLPMKN